MREFVAAGGEMIVHGVLYLKNSPTLKYLSRSVVKKNGGTIFRFVFTTKEKPLQIR
jgi:hypothetical protein